MEKVQEVEAKDQETEEDKEKVKLVGKELEKRKGERKEIVNSL